MQHLFSTLPVELLQTIFTHAMQPTGPDVNIAEKTLLRKTILACAQVCRLWRHAVRGYSPLWPHSIDFQRHLPEVVKDLLPLSRPHPVDVGHRSAPFIMFNEKSLDILHHLKHDWNRIREWNIQVHPSFDNIAGTHMLFGSTAWQDPHSVKTLRWSGITRMHTDALPFMSSSLQKLQLYNTDIAPCYWMDSSNLTELSVVSTAAGSARCSLIEWFALLRGAHRLRFLELRDAMQIHSPLDDVLAQLPDDIILPELRVVSLAESNAIGALMALSLCAVLERPHTCCVDLDLPSPTELASYEEHLNIGTVRTMFALISALMHEYAQPNRLLVYPQVEISAQTQNAGIQFTLGTVRNPATTLDWNGVRGTEGVQKYIDDYFGGDSIPLPLPRHPPFSVTIHDPYAEDITCAAIIASLSLITTTTVRVAIDSYLSRSAHLGQIVDGILGTLSRADEARTLVLNIGAFVALVPTLYRSRYLPGDKLLLPALKYVLVESTSMASEADIGVVANDVREIMLDYVGWRDAIGFPVDFSWCVEGGADS